MLSTLQSDHNAYMQKPDPEPWRHFHYSSLAWPFVLGNLALFIALAILSVWQTHADLFKLADGMPRDMTVDTGDNEQDHVPNFQRGLRIAASTMGLTFVCIAFALFAIHIPRPHLRAIANYIIAACLFITAIVAIVAFGFDLGSAQDAKRCVGTAHSSQVCESLQGLAIICIVFDALLALAALTSAVFLSAYTATGDWCRQIAYTSDDQPHVDDTWPGLKPNSVSSVRKFLTSAALVFTAGFAIVLLTATLTMTGEPFIDVDSNNRLLSIPGWPVRNTVLRYFLCVFVIFGLVVNLIMLKTAILADVLAWWFMAGALLSWVAFGLDLSSLSKAASMPCPSGAICTNGPYSATAALDCLGGFSLVAYVIWEYCFSKRSIKEDWQSYRQKWHRVEEDPEEDQHEQEPAETIDIAAGGDGYTEFRADINDLQPAPPVLTEPAMRSVPPLVPSEPEPEIY